MTRKEPPPKPVAIAMMMTPKRSNCLDPVFRTAEAEETITANKVVQYNAFNRSGEGLRDIIL
jgi:hypothetical protein